MKKIFHSKGIALLLCIAAVLIVLIPVFGLIEHAVSKTETVSWEETGAGEAGGLYIQDTWYMPKKSVETILILGTDTMVSGDDTEKKQGQVDFLVLLVMDQETEEIRLLHLNRDTMTDIHQTDLTGKDAGVFTGQLALAYAYGQDAEDGCRNTCDAVENLLYGVEIDHYLAFTMDAVSILNDKVGGVTVELLDDFTHIDETWQAGTVVTLTGEQALTYVRERGRLADSSNLRRMERQQQYLGALFDSFVRSSDGMTEEETFFDTLMEISAYMVSDCTVEKLSVLLETMRLYSYGGISTIEGEAAEGYEYMEFYMDEASAREVVLELFYTPAES